LRASRRIDPKDRPNSAPGLSLTTWFSKLTSKPVEVMLRRAINREKFPRELDKSRAINSMKHSILHATAVHAIDFGYIQGARRRIEALRSTKTDPVESPTVSELEEPLGESGRKVRPVRKKMEEPALSSRTCRRRFRPRETAGHGDRRDASMPV